MQKNKKNTSPQGIFELMKKSIVAMHTFFFEEFKKRGVVIEQENEDAITGKHWYFRRDYSYDFNFSTDFKTEGFLFYKIKICFFTDGHTFVRFDWSTNDSSKRYRMSSKGFSQHKLKDEKVLDLMSRFMKGEFVLDKTSRKAFLKEFNIATH